MQTLFYSDRFCQIAWLVDLATAGIGHIVCKNLFSNDDGDRGYKFHALWHPNDVVGVFRYLAIPLGCNGQDGGFARTTILHVGNRLFTSGNGGHGGDHGYVLAKQGEWTVLQLGCVIALSVGV